MSRSRHMSVAIVCFSSFGGSGVLATELAKGLVRQKHEVHVLALQQPARWPEQTPSSLHFHQVEVPDYPLFTHAPYALALASAIVRLCETQSIDILHLHYALPHAVSAQLAIQMLGEAKPRTFMTLHGTDVTGIGAEPSYQPVVRAALLQMDMLSTPSVFLAQQAEQLFALPAASLPHVIPNFIDTEVFVPASHKERGRLAPLFAQASPSLHDAPTLVHISNFRPVKRVMDVVEVFASLAATTPMRLLWIGNGPQQEETAKRIEALGLSAQVCFLGFRQSFVSWLQHCDVMLLPSAHESFGLAALEAMSCGVPVVASDIGGLPELVRHGENGFLAPVGDVSAMAAAVSGLLQNEELAARCAAQARQDAVKRWSLERALAAYESCYQQLLEQRDGIIAKANSSNAIPGT